MPYRTDHITATDGADISGELSTERIGTGHWRVPSDATGGDVQDIIDAATAGDLIVVERPSGGYIETTQAINFPDKPLTFRGEAFHTSERNLVSFDGAVIRSTNGAENIVNLTLDKESVHFHDIGFEYDPGLSSTEHGVVCDSASDGSGGKTLGLQQAYWSNVAVRNVDADKYCYRFINSQYNLSDALKYHGGGGVEFVIEEQPIHPANHVFVDFSGDTTAQTDGADGIHFTADGDTLGFVVFIRPQNGWIGSPDSTQHYVDYTELNGGDVTECAFMHPLWENPDASLDIPPGSRGFNLQGVNGSLDVSNFILTQMGSTTINTNKVASNFINPTYAVQVNRAGFNQAISGSTGSATISLNGSVAGTDYAVALNADWQTTYTVSNKQNGQFDVTFGTDSPAGGGNVEGWVVRGMP